MTQSENSHGNASQLIGKVYEILSSLVPPQVYEEHIRQNSRQSQWQGSLSIRAPMQMHRCPFYVKPYRTIFL